MRIELKNVTITGTHPDGDDLNKLHCCLEVNGEKVVVNIEELVEALKLIGIRK